MILSPLIRQRFFDVNGVPLAGGQLFSYIAGTTTPQGTFTNQGGTPNTNPVVLDAYGYADVWINPNLTYKFVLEDVNNNVQWTIDNVNPPGNTLIVTAVSSNISVVAANNGCNFLVSASGNINFQLPSPSLVGAGFNFKLTDALGVFGSYAISVLPFSTEKIQGSNSNYSLTANFGSWSFFTDGTNWYLNGASGVATSTFTAPTFSQATASGTGTGGFGSSQAGWLFTVTGWSGTIAIGDTYTNNGHSYTAIAAQTNGASGQTLWMSGTGVTSGGTLTKGTSASGPATITFSATTAYYIYTTPTSPRKPLSLWARLVGGGGGGNGTGQTVANAGTSTFFGANLLATNAGTIGYPSAGGTFSLGGLTGLGFNGSGSQFSPINGVLANASGGVGASSPFGGGGYAGAGTGPYPGGDAATNSGSGGGGAGGTGSYQAGNGGPPGGYIDIILTGANVLSSFPYIIGTGGTGGAATNGAAGGSAAAGQIFIEERFQ